MIEVLIILLVAVLYHWLGYRKGLRTSERVQPEQEQK